MAVTHPESHEFKTLNQEKPTTASGFTQFKFVDNYSNTVAQASIWTENLPRYGGYRKIAFVGGYSAGSHAHGLELLHEVEEYARSLGHDYLIGPVDGNTWSKYRFTTDGFDSPAFALESLTESAFPVHFKEAGFESIAQYQSSIVETKQEFSPDEKALLERLSLAGISIRPFDCLNPELELDRLYEVSIKAFEKNFLYTPVDRMTFCNMYKPILPLVDPELVLIAEDKDKKPVGFVFALPNKLLAPGRDDTVVLKTLARVPGDRFKGLGLVLVSLCHKTAHQKGYKRMIHALYKNDNRSSCFSQLSGAETIRQYELFGKEIV